MINELYATVIDLRAATDKEWMQREEVKQSGDYHITETRIAQLNDLLANEREVQQHLLSEVPDSRPALEEAKRALYEVMLLEGREKVGDASIKYSSKSEVNKERLLNDLQGDLDLYITLSNVTQARLKEFVKESGDKKLLNCIETVTTPVGLGFPTL